MTGATVASLLAAGAALASIFVTVQLDKSRRGEERAKEARQRAKDDLYRRGDTRIEAYASAFANLTELEHQLRDALSTGAITRQSYPPIEETHLRQVMSHAQVQLIAGPEVVSSINRLAMTLSTVTLSLRKIGGSLPKPADVGDDDLLQRAASAMEQIREAREGCREAMRAELAPLVELSTATPSHGN